MKKILSIVLLSTFCASTAMARDSSPKYGIKSCYVVYEWTALLNKIGYSTLKFDDYGEKKLSTFNLPDNHVASIYLAETDKYLDIDFTRKTIETKEPEGRVFGNRTSEELAEMGVREMGTATVKGKKCSIYAWDDAESGIKYKGWEWQGIPLKTVIEKEGITITMTVKEIKENVEIDPSEFEIPDFASRGYTVIEPTPDRQGQ